MENKNNDLSNYMFGKLPPQNVALEKIVIGGLLIDRHSFSKIEFLKTEHFYLDAHQLIFESISALFHRSIPIDLMTIVEDLKKKNKMEDVGGHFYLMELANNVGSSANIETHARILMQKAIQRQLITYGTMLINSAYEDTTDVFDLLDFADSNLMKIADVLKNENIKNASEIMFETLKEIESRVKAVRGGGIAGLSTGFIELDKKLGGLKGGKYYIIAGRPGMTKSVAMLEFTENISSRGDAVGCLSIEMPIAELGIRMLASDAEIDGHRIESGYLNDAELTLINEKINRISQLNFHIDDSPRLNILELKSKARKMVKKFGIKILFIDYLQLARGMNSKQVLAEQISELARCCKELAKELNIPIVSLAQLNRELEKRTDKKPQLSDLKESGGLEENADVVILLFRPEYYGFLDDADGNSLKEKICFIVAKHRGGATGDVWLKYVSRYLKYYDIVEPQNDMPLCF